MTIGAAGQTPPGVPGVPEDPEITVSGVAGVPGMVMSGMPGPPGIVVLGVPGEPGITVSGEPGVPGLAGVGRQRVADLNFPGSGGRLSGIALVIWLVSSVSGAARVISICAPLSSRRRSTGLLPR
jgi:hypothetical protein